MKKSGIDYIVYRVTSKFMENYQNPQYTVKIAMFIRTYMSIYITAPFIPAALEEAKPINT